MCRELRRRGVPVTPQGSIDAVRTLGLVDLGDVREVHHALRTVLATRIEDYRTFDEVFAAFFRVGEPPVTSARGPGKLRKLAPDRQRSSLQRWVSSPESEPEASMPVAAMSDQESPNMKDLSGYSDHELAALLRFARRMARRLALRPARRWQSSRRGPDVHARRTMLRALRTYGDPIEMSYRRRKIRRAKLFVLCDVSGSMDMYARFLMQLLYALQDAFARVETFVFSTRLTRVTGQLRTLTFEEALGRLSQVRGFSGGTRIGESLASFLERWGREIDTRSIVLILSDGWDTGEPDDLASVMRRIHERAGRVIWLNPLLGSPDYRPLAGGMQAALPYIDVFAPAHDLESLRSMIRYLNV
jgi:uncharacterized protein with von Willebrand factor type A (vWA) domain